MTEDIAPLSFSPRSVVITTDHLTIETQSPPSYKASPLMSSAAVSPMANRFAGTFASLASTLKRTRSNRTIGSSSSSSSSSASPNSTGGHQSEHESSTSPSSSSGTVTVVVALPPPPPSKLSPHRSCLTKHKNHIIKRQRTVRRAHFADELVTAVHESKEREADDSENSMPSYSSWLLPSDILLDRKKDAESVEYDVAVQNYLRGADAAYLEVVNTSNTHPTASSSYKQYYQQLMVQGAHSGHRALEHQFSRDGRSRLKSRRLAVLSIVAKSRLLARQQRHNLGLGLSLLSTTTMTNASNLSSPSPVHTLTINDAHQLRKHSLKLSRRAEQWALFLAEVDALAARVEYDGIPSTLFSKSMSHQQNQHSSPLSTGKHNVASLDDKRRWFFFMAQ